MCVGCVKEHDTRLRIEMRRALPPHQFKKPRAANRGFERASKARIGTAAGTTKDHHGI
jgi:hypothetical protein